MDIGGVSKILPFMCRMGWHVRRGVTDFVPSIHADIVTEVEFSVVCARCGTKLESKIYRWDGDDMVLVE